MRVSGAMGMGSVLTHRLLGRKAGISPPSVGCQGALLCIVSQDPLPSSRHHERAESQQNPAASNTLRQSGPEHICPPGEVRGVGR